MIEEISQTIKEKIGNKSPKTAIILGSGLGGLADEINDSVIIDYKDIKNFPQSTISGHKGRLVVGTLNGQEVLCMQGRIHLSEGHSPKSIDLIIKVFSTLGITNLIVTNASGSLNKEIPVGSLMLIKDHINFSGQNPLVGPNDDKYGPRFPDLSNAYDRDIRAKVKTLAQKEHIKLHEGVYMCVLGPNFETAAEVRAFRILGADAVGMSTVPEVISAIHSDMKVLGISVVTNFGTGLQEHSQSHAETLAQAQNATNQLIRLIKAYLQNE